MRYRVLFFSSVTSSVTKNFFKIAEQHHEEVSLGNLKRFQFRELQMATNNFSNKNIIGKGGFGNVYKGYIRDGTVVAVKRLKDGNTSGGEIQFQTEVEMISLAVHRNLLRLYGFCMTASERLLVYPYMSNGSVASCLKGKKKIIKNSVLLYSMALLDEDFAIVWKLIPFSVSCFHFAKTLKIWSIRFIKNSETTYTNKFTLACGLHPL